MDNKTYTLLVFTPGKTVPQVAIRWLLQKKSVPSVVIGVRTLAQLEDNMLAATGWELSKQEVRA